MDHNISSVNSCPSWLKPTSQQWLAFRGFPSCGLQCGDPFFSPEEQRDFQMVMLTMIIICVICNLFGAVSLILKLHTVRNTPFNPDKCVLLKNVSFLLASFGYLLSFFPRLRQAATCSDDGLRQHLTHSSDFSSTRVSLCTLTFCLTFIFTLAGLVWFGHLMFACHLDFRRIINSYKKNKGELFVLSKSSFVFFYGTAFLIPVIMAASVIFLQSVEGDYVLGVCWIKPGHTTFTIFYLAQFTIILSIALFFVLLYWWNLRRAELGQFGSLKAQRNALRRLRFVGIMCMTILFFYIVQLAGIWVRSRYDDDWSNALRDFILCDSQKSDSSEEEHCSKHLESVKVSYVVAHYLMVVSYFATGIVISAWSWNLPNIRRWKALFSRNKGKFSIREDGFEPDGKPNSSLIFRKNGVVQPRTFLSPDPEMELELQKFQRPSALSGKKIATVSDFTPHRKLENWAEDARNLRVNRRKSDAEHCNCCTKGSFVRSCSSRSSMPQPGSQNALHNGRILTRKMSQPEQYKSQESGIVF